MTADMETRRQAFLTELRDLTLKHNVIIGACGCCNSPWLVFDADTINEQSYYESSPVNTKSSDNLEWLSKKD